jgi:hypothetical protein
MTEHETATSAVPVPTFEVLRDVARERAAQIAKWGDQSAKPDADPVILSRLETKDRYGTPPAVAGRLVVEYGVRSATMARQACQHAAAMGEDTWAHIALEEVAETIEAVAFAVAEDDPAKLREEIIQTAAVFVAWAEAIDRRGLKRTPRTA